MHSMCEAWFAAAGDVIELKQAPGKSFSYKELKAAIEKNKPAALFLCQVGVQLKDKKNAI